MRDTTYSGLAVVLPPTHAKAAACSIDARQDTHVAYSDSQLLRIRTDSGDDQLRSLLAWLQWDDALRGEVQLEHKPVNSDEMGGVVDALSVTLGSGGVAVALARSLTAWISQRRSDVKFTVNASNGRSVEVDAKRVDAQALARDIERILSEEGES